MAPSGATFTPGSVTVAPGMATGAMNGPDAPAAGVPARPPSGDAARAMRAASAPFVLRCQRGLNSNSFGGMVREGNARAGRNSRSPGQMIVTGHEWPPTIGSDAEDL